MTSIKNDIAWIETEIADANPVPPGSLPSASSSAGQQILSKALAAPAPAPPAAADRSGRARRPAWTSTSPRTRIATVAVTAVVAAVAAIGISQLPGSAPGNGTGPNPQVVTDSLTELAGVAAGQPAAGPLRRGQYQYTKSVAWNFSAMATRHGTFWMRDLERRQAWIGWNGSGRIKQALTDRHFLSRQDRTAWIAAGRPPLGHARFDQRFHRHGLQLAPVNEWKLPTNPALLGAEIRARKIEPGPPGPFGDFQQIGDLLRETNAPPALRAALFKVAASIPGVRVLGRTADRLGRTGIVVAFEGPQLRGKHAVKYGLIELIFAPKTSAMLDEKSFIERKATSFRRLTAWTSYIGSGVVDSVTAVAPPYDAHAKGGDPA